MLWAVLELIPLWCIKSPMCDLPTDGLMDGPMDGPTVGPTNGQSLL